MSTHPQPPELHSRRAARRHLETRDPVSGCWPNPPFPPPLLGVDYRLVDRAAGAWLRIVADCILDGGHDLNILFDPQPVADARERLALPEAAVPVITAAGCFTLGSLRSRQAGASLSSLFALPVILQIARLDQAALLLGEDG